MAPRTMCCALLLGIAMISAAAPAAALQSGTSGLQRSAIFTDYSAWSRSAEIVRRMMSPLDAARVLEESARAGKGLREQAIDLPNERFALYAPPHVPPQGYAVLVFVPPWEVAAVPPRWTSALDRHDMIFVSAGKSGNEANVLDRREPLALLALHNVMSRYPVDAQRVYIGGFSGGSRVAVRLALAYPDVFHGALLNAGSDPIGNAQAPLPSAERLRQFQESTRLVFATGERDDGPLSEDIGTRQSLRDWCVFGVTTMTVPSRGHELLDEPTFERSLDALLKPVPSDAGKLAECRAHIDQELNSRLRQVEDLLGSGKLDEARRLLDKIDVHYGGLAAPRSTALAGQWMHIPN
jgi:predicted esterase